MNAQDDAGATDATEETESQTEATEQQASTGSFQDTLLAIAAQEGHVLGLEEPKEPEPEQEPAEEGTGEETSEEPEKAEPSPPKEVWPSSAKQRVAEETDKRKRANDRADKAEARIAELERYAASIQAPTPTQDEPFRDIQDIRVLENLERSYDKAIDLADDNPDGAVDVVIGRDKNGNEIRRDFTPEELAEVKRKAEKAIRKFIPDRRKYIEQRAIADAQAVQVYPEYGDLNSQFTQTAAFLAQKILNGQAHKEPELLVWIGHAVKGYQDYLKRNGQSSNTRRIVESARTRVAPTTTVTRSFSERRGSANLAKAQKELEQTGTTDAAEKYVAALFSNRSGSPRRTEPIAE